MHIERPPRNRHKALWLLIPFSLPFMLFGGGIGFFALRPVMRSIQAQPWSVLPAYIDSASINTSRTSKGGTTRKLVAHYHYEVNGQHYESDMVSFYSGSDNFDTFHEERLRELTPFIGSAAPFRAHVNPTDPHEAVLFPDVRWTATSTMLIFGAIFFIVGATMLVWSVIGTRRAKDSDRRAELAPNQPWMHRKDWAERRMRCSSKATVIGLAIVAFVWNGISLFVPLSIYRQYQTGKMEWVMFIFLIFPLVGLILLWGWSVMFLRWRRFGSSELMWDRNPLSLGGELRGTLVAPRKLLDVTRELAITLVCQEHLTTGSGKSRSTRTTTVTEFKDSVQLTPAMARNTSLHVPMKLVIPQLGRLTLLDGNPRISWKLTASASIPGANYSAEFEIPVFEKPSADIGKQP